MDTRKRQDSVRAASTRLQDEASRLFNLLAKTSDGKDGNFDLEALIGDSIGTSVNDVFVRIQTAAELMTAISTSDELPIVPNVWWTNLGDFVSQATNQISQMSAWAEQWPQSDTLMIDGSSLNWRAQSGSTMELSGPLRSIDQNIDGILDCILKLRGAMTRPNIAQSSEFISRQAAYQKDLAAIIGTLAKLSQDASKIESILQVRLQNVQELEAAVRNARTESVDHAAAVAEERTRISSIVTQLNPVVVEATALSQRVTEYSAKFAEFDRALDQRTQDIVDGQQKLSDLQDRNSIFSAQSSEMIKKAREALGWSTAQGLAQGFSQEAEFLDKPIENAILSVYISLFVFAVWAFAVFIVPQWIGLPLPNFTTLDPNAVGTSIAQGFLALGTRLALLFPAIYLVFFCSKRYRELFIVREQYVFKKAIATAVPGFKEQAAPADVDDHVRAMTAAAFERLLFNPREAATRDLSGEARGGVLSRWLVRIVARAIDETHKLSDKAPKS
jgi:hypothetical protein